MLQVAGNSFVSVNNHFITPSNSLKFRSGNFRNVFESNKNAKDVSFKGINPKIALNAIGSLYLLGSSIHFILKGLIHLPVIQAYLCISATGICLGLKNIKEELEEKNPNLLNKLNKIIHLKIK